jgi:hypothetical protein
MLQYLYNETAAAAEEIVEAVAPELDETSKEDIAEAAADQAEVITDAVADASAAEGAEFTEEQYDAIHATCAQVIYTEVMSQLACQQAQFAMEDLFTEEAVEEFYASLEEEAGQEQYADGKLGFLGKLNRGKWVGKHGVAAGMGAVGAVGGAVIGKKIAAKKGISQKKGAIIGALVGGAAGTAGGYASTAAGRLAAKKGLRRIKATGKAFWAGK